MTEELNILDLDVLTHIGDYVPVNPAACVSYICSIVDLLEIYGYPSNNNTTHHRRYSINIKYLNHIFYTEFNYSKSEETLILKYYSDRNDPNCKYNLELVFSKRNPEIRWIEKGPNVPKYLDANGTVILGEGGFLINFAHRFINFLSYDKIYLDDDSMLRLPSGQTLKLWLYLIITKGRPWYSKFGYVSLNTNPSEYEYLVNKLQEFDIEFIYNILREKYALTAGILLKYLEGKTGRLQSFIKELSLDDAAVFINTLYHSSFQKEKWYDLIHQVFLANILMVNTSPKFVRLVDDL